MKTGSVKYLITQGALNVMTNKQMTFASVGVLIACLILIGSAALFSANVNSLVGYVESRNEIVVYLLDSVDDTGIARIGEQIKNTAGVAKVTYVSKAEALERQKAQLGEAGSLLEEYKDDNPLPNSYSVVISDVSKMSGVTAALRSLEGVEKVNAPLQYADTLTSIKNIVTVFGICIVGVLTLVALVIIANTVRLTVFARRREVNIMKFVGATDDFIRIPFVTEGVIIGLFSGMLSFLIIWIGYEIIFAWLTQSGIAFLQFGNTVLVPFWSVGFALLGSFCLSGALVGAVGSLLALRKHLRV